MSNLKFSAQFPNYELLNQIYNKISKSTNPQILQISSVEELIDAIVDNEFKSINITPPLITKSDVQINITEDVLKLSPDENNTWIFGYGSLVWKADFPYVVHQIGYIKGFERRFYQNSIDHRGTQENPGRVVTLIRSSDPESKVFGMAYKISNEQKEDVLKHLDFREKNGYQRITVNFYPYSSGKQAENSFEIIMYIAVEGNESYAGHINDLNIIAQQIYAATGPSGTNREYVYKLANAMRNLFPGEMDEHLFGLEKTLRNREEKELEIIKKFKDNMVSIVQNAISTDLPLSEIVFKIKKELDLTKLS